MKVYADRAQTGRNDNREQFQLMLADAAKHAFDALIVWKTDRIGRNKEEIALNKYHLKKNGVKIYYGAEAIPDTPEGIILEAVIEGMDYTDIDCQKRLIKIFLNSVFVYDDKVVLTFNYSEDGKVMTLHEIFSFFLQKDCPKSSRHCEPKAWQSPPPRLDALKCRLTSKILDVRC